MRPYDVVDVSAWQLVSDENLGSKAKSWLRDPAGERWLLKYPRENTGDDWAEKVTAELGRLIGLPCPRVELALSAGRRATITESFLPKRKDVLTRLIHGNELFSLLDPSYPKAQDRKVSQHSIGRIAAELRSWDVGPAAGAPLVEGVRSMSALECFVGYLAFDAWIGNQDRHHENWGILAVLDPDEDFRVWLAPSFDHAASLGQFLHDEERLARLETRDAGYSVDAYAARGRSHLYLTGAEEKPAKLRQAFAHAAHLAPEAALHWRQRIVEANMEGVAEVVHAVPPDWMSELARRFAVRLLEVNRDALEALEIP